MSKQGDWIAKTGKQIDYEQAALNAVQRSYTAGAGTANDVEAAVVAQADLIEAQVWATLHLARVTRTVGGSR